MKRILFFLWMTCMAAAYLPAQENIKIDSLQFRHVQQFDDGFLLDLDLLKPIDTPVLPFAHSLTALMPDYSRLFATPTVTYSTLSGNLHLPAGARYSLGAFGYPAAAYIPTTGILQVANFRLRNGMTISTMGDYDQTGTRVNRPVLPWQRNNFQGAFQIKSADGKFSFNIHVQQQRGY